MRIFDVYDRYTGERFGRVWVDGKTLRYSSPRLDDLLESYIHHYTNIVQFRTRSDEFVSLPRAKKVFYALSNGQPEYMGLKIVRVASKATGR